MISGPVRQRDGSVGQLRSNRWAVGQGVTKSVVGLGCSGEVVQ
jgi:hypothetical protein